MEERPGHGPPAHQGRPGRLARADPSGFAQPRYRRPAAPLLVCGPAPEGIVPKPAPTDRSGRVFACPGSRFVAVMRSDLHASMRPARHAPCVPAPRTDPWVPTPEIVIGGVDRDLVGCAAGSR